MAPGLAARATPNALLKAPGKTLRHVSFSVCESTRMTDWSFESTELGAMDKASLPRKIFTRVAPVLAVMSFSALVAVRVASSLAPNGAAEAQPKPAPVVAQQSAKPAAAKRVAEPVIPPQAPALRVAAKAPSTSPYGELFDPDYASIGLADARPAGLDASLFSADPMYKAEPEATQVAEAEPEPAAPLSASQKTAAELGLRLAQDESIAPLPPTRPSDLTRLARVEEEAPPLPPPAPDRAQVDRAQADRAQSERAKEQPQPRIVPRVATRHLRDQPRMQAQNDPRGFFEKLFDSGEQKGPQLAYASPDGGSSFKLSRGMFAAARPSEGVAVYNISAHTVTLPSGAQLEAHSGLGPLFDNPDGVHQRMRGATPPATYKLSLRESLFHGVQALRLTPLDSNVHGRNGLLAHTFMLGPRGDSNGCVSFRNYRAFLDAYRNGEISHLKVVRGDS